MLTVSPHRILTEVYIQIAILTDRNKICIKVRGTNSSSRLVARPYMAKYTLAGNISIRRSESPPLRDQANLEFIDSLYLISQTMFKDAESAFLSFLFLDNISVFGTSTQKIERIFSECQTILRQEWFGKEAVFLRKY